MKNNWLIYAVWWICGVMCGLTVAQFLVADEELSLILSYITMGFLAVDVVVFAITMWRLRK